MKKSTFKKTIKFTSIILAVTLASSVFSSCTKLKSVLENNISNQIFEFDGESSLPEANSSNKTDFQENLEVFAKYNGLSLNDWPAELVEKAELNPELWEFTLNYPLKKDLNPEIDLSENLSSDSVPLFFQWDERWGYSTYADNLMGLSGCGPTCLSMVGMYILKDSNLTPKYVADFSENNGYSVSGEGSSWTLISQGGKDLGLDVIEIPLDENRIKSNLDVDNPIICIMGPGDFTTNGHFIVMTDYIDGKIKINDPNSKIRSEQLWDYSDIKDQILNLWVCR